jgi:hypothetical protein
MKVYSLMRSFFKELAPTWRKTQLDNLTDLTQALFARKTLCVAHLAREYRPKHKPKVNQPKHVLFHRLKRLRRFLDNPRLDLEAVFTRLTRLSFSVCKTPGLVLPVLLDPTYFGDYTAIVASIPRGGRALPIVWRVVRRDLAGETELSQNLMVRKLLDDLLRRLSGVVQMVVVADAEFAAGQFFGFLKGRQAQFVIRVDPQTWVLSPEYSGPMGDLPIRAGGRRVWLKDVQYSKEHRERVNLLVVWRDGHKEAWFLATNLDDPVLVERLYRKRMKIEQGFRDWKHHLRLKGTMRVELVGRAKHLIMAVALLYWFISLVGVRVDTARHRAKVCYWGQTSYFTTALELLGRADEAALRAAQRVVAWVADKLLALKPDVPRYQLRYLRYRPWLLHQSGSQ